MVEFAEMKQRSVPQMANGILAAGLISEDVTKALNPALKVSEERSVGVAVVLALKRVLIWFLKRSRSDAVPSLSNAILPGSKYEF